MILVTVGTEKFAFNRLMQWVEQLIQQQSISEDEEIIVQYGCCTFIPDGTKAYSLLPAEEFEQLLSQARLIIAHCGEGTIDTVAKINVPFILVPRSHQFGEHVDNHQVELADALAEQGIAIARTQQDLAQFVASPQLANLTTAPSDYYTYACQLIEQEFVVNKNTNYSIVNLTNKLSKLLQKIFCQQPALSQ